MHSLRIISVAVAVLVAVFFPPAESPSGWIDDWFDQKTGTSAGYYEGQKRGYYSAGGFSGRVKLSVDPAFTAMPPQIKAGCGGIDAFWGGFGFLNFDYLVQKVQRILQSAPAAAFDIALNTLCTPCAQTIKSLEAISNQLNSIQLDDCKASRAVATYAVDAFSGNRGKMGDLSSIKSEFLQAIGAKNLAQTVREETAAIGNSWSNWQSTGTRKNMAIAAADNPVSTCSAVIRDLFISEGFLLAKAGAMAGLDQDFLAMARGLIGDVYIHPYEGVTVVPIPHCSENNLDKAADLISKGQGYVRVVDGDDATHCRQYDGVSLQSKIRTRINGIIGAMKNKSPITLEDENFLIYTPLSLGLILKHAVMMGVDEQLAQDIPDLIARVYAYLFLTDVLSNIEFAIASAEQAASAHKGGGSSSTCMMEMTRDSMASLKEIRRRAEILVGKLKSEYQEIMLESNSLQNWVERQKAFSRLAYDDLQKRFGMAVANRAMGLW
ncbi:MAG: conjugal transfer protein TraH [Syntrophales bacterium]|nr:conjugal transfer protein TraH [Syntrophales bacterium]